MHSSSTERSIFLHRAIGTIATWMQGHKGFRQALDVDNEAGIAQRVKQANKKERDDPQMPVELRRDLDRYYVPTVYRVEKVIGRKIKPWRAKATASIPDPVNQKG